MEIVTIRIWEPNRTNISQGFSFLIAYCIIMTHTHTYIYICIHACIIVIVQPSARVDQSMPMVVWDHLNAPGGISVGVSRGARGT